MVLFSEDEGLGRNMLIMTNPSVSDLCPVFTSSRSDTVGVYKPGDDYVKYT